MTSKEPEEYFELAQCETKNRNWRIAKGIITLCFFIAIAVCLYMLIENLNWLEVKQVLHAYEKTTLVLCLIITVASYIAFSSYDLLGRAYTDHRLSNQQILSVAFVCYAFNLNLSSWIGGVAMRYRLYSRLGLRASTITKVLGLSVFTNTLGYIIVAGIIFSWRLVTLPSSWALSGNALQIIGVMMLLFALSYLLLCQFSTRRTWQWSTHTVTLPSLQLALAQVGLSTLNWLLMALLIFLLLPNTVSYSAVLGILLISGIAGMIAQIPAGLGVLETVFISILQHQLSTASIIAALIAYRVIYFLLPLLLAFLMYLLLEGKAKYWRWKKSPENYFEGLSPNIFNQKKITTQPAIVLNKSSM